MTAEQIAAAVSALETQARAAGHDGLLPGLITVQADTWIDMQPRLTALCSVPALGIRHRGLRVVVGRNQENRVLTRDEAGETGAPYLDLEPAADA